jgi:hypothetical protein
MASGNVVALMDKKPPPPGWRLEGRLVDVTPHPAKRLILRRPIMRTILLEALLTAELSSLPSKRRAI